MIVRITFIFLLICSLSCSKQDITCSYNTEFCNFVNSKDYIGAANVMNKFLTLIDSNKSDKSKIEYLEKWLKCKPCVSSIEGICVSCAWSNPPISYIEVKIIENGQTVEKKVVVLMSTLPNGRFYN
jgi:hypothetical protein